MHQYCLNKMVFTYYQKNVGKPSPLVCDIIQLVESLGMQYSLSDNEVVVQQKRILVTSDKQVIFENIMEVFNCE